ncbi:hypothetical protein Q7P37_006138 [Cladosporium fusiforme]
MDDPEYDCDMLDDIPDPQDGGSSAQPGNTANTPSRIDVIAKIESIFESMTDVLLNERGHLSIALVAKTTAKPKVASSDSITAQPESIQYIRFPGRSEREAWRFTVVTRILELIHEALRQEVVISKRDIYYRDPALFSQQSHVDRYVDIIANTFHVPRSALHVTAAAKGLITGCARFCRRDGSIIDASQEKHGLLVPDMKDILSIDLTSAKWILVIEKEATFRSIASSDYWDDLSTNGIMVTAKGYPDLATRVLLKFLSNPSPQNGFAAPPVHALVDFDPDGMAILSTYKHGSANLAHETEHLQLPQIQHLGLGRAHVLSSNDSQASQMLTLTMRDRNKARKMLEWEVLADEGDFRASLQVMLMINVKAELQLLDAAPNGMAKLLIQGLPG